MPRKSLGPRLYLRKEVDGSKRWIIRDRNRDSRTGFAEHQRSQAEAILAEYIAGTFKPKRATPTGIIYFATCLSSSNYPIKIGWTFTRADLRLVQLQCGNPNRLTMVATIIGSQEDERKLHFYFSHLHVRGEWFLRGADLLDYLGELPGQFEAYGADEFVEGINAPAQQQLMPVETNVNESATNGA